ncbi:MAG: SUMF1/EgtB/PvdO family nonheme iron enzyme [bacterium]
MAKAEGRRPLVVCSLPFASAKAGQAHTRRVLRGGAFNNDNRNVRCAYRNRNNPNNQNRNIGFRVAALTFFFIRIARCLAKRDPAPR